MKKIYGGLALVLLCLFLSQCQRDLSYIGAPDPTGPLILNPEPISATLQGNVLDEGNMPAAGATITLGGQTIVTNASGYFRINNAQLDKNASLVTVEKAGYFKAYRVFAATTGANQVVVKLIRKVLAGTVSAAPGGTVNLSNGSKVDLPANSIVDAASGNAYNGDVRVYAAYIDPTSADIAETVPGSLMANDKTGSRVVLASYGMMAVELESTSGLKLQVKTGSAAKLTMPIPASLQSSAGSTVPLWYVDEKTGIWQEEGSATKQGNSFVGEVKHFSFWNCDAPFPAVSISMTLRSSGNLPLVNVKTLITSGDGGSSAYGYTDSAGQVKGLVPASRNLVLEVFDPCGKSVYSQAIAPLTKATDLGTLSVATSTASLVTFQGKLLDCGGLPVKKGYAMISFNNSFRYAQVNANGEYSTSFITCSGAPASSVVIGVDETALQQSTAATIAVTAPITNAGTISACGTSAIQFINYKIDATDYKISTTDSLYAFTNTQGLLTIFGSQFSGVYNYLSVSVKNATATGVYPVNEIGLQSYRQVKLGTPFNITFTNFAKTAGEFYEGSIAGQFTADSSATVHTLSASFKVRKI